MEHVVVEFKAFNVRLFRRMLRYCLSFVIPFALLPPLSVSADELADEVVDEIYTEFFSDKALSGYDTVAYHTLGKPVKGSAKYTSEYLDAKWYFKTAEHKALFDQNPDKYRPQYGGHCAWALGANNAKAPGNPKYWRIVDEKLYLNFSKDVQKKWLKDVPGFIAKADKNWPAILAE